MIFQRGDGGAEALVARGDLPGSGADIGLGPGFGGRLDLNHNGRKCPGLGIPLPGDGESIEGRPEEKGQRGGGQGENEQRDEHFHQGEAVGRRGVGMLGFHGFGGVLFK